MFNRKDFIYRKRSAYSQEGCDHAIKFFEKRVDLQQEGAFGKDRVEPEFKKCTEMYLKREEYPIFDDVLHGCAKDYIKIYPSSLLLDGWKPSPIFKIQKYLPEEGYFIEHCENCGMRDSLYRVLAWMIYLNNVTEGGHTRFPNQNRKFQPRRGDLLIWPAHFTHTHHGIASKTQTKYIATGWFIFKEAIALGYY